MIKKTLKPIIERLYWRAHDKKVLEVRKRAAREDFSAEFYRLLDQPWLHAMELRTVIDIGASVGNFSKTAFAVFKGISVVAFEPLPDEFTELTARLEGAGPFKAFNVALSDKEGRADFHVNAYSSASSLLAPKQALKRHFDFTQEDRVITVPVRSLDSYYPELKLDRNVLVKIDVQGGELGVIRGGQRVLAETRVVIVETSFRALYQGQPLFDEVHRSLQGLGFRYHGSFHQLLAPTDRQPLEQDSIYIRE